MIGKADEVTQLNRVDFIEFGSDKDCGRAKELQTGAGDLMGRKDSVNNVDTDEKELGRNECCCTKKETIAAAQNQEISVKEKPFLVV